jgi:CRISPR-associated endonuclease Csn1
MEPKKFTLGLDLGTNSIGWALVAHDTDGEPSGLEACGARIFQEAVDAKTRVPKNQARRTARGIRKQVARRRQRRDNLLNILERASLLPASPNEREKILASNAQYDPYALRARALDHKIERFDLGRVLYHLCKRRGFQSNRKAQSTDDGVVKSSITKLGEDIILSGKRTLGEYLAVCKKKRGIYTSRAMYQHEFEEIWKAQQNHHPELLTPALKTAVHNAIFFQRPLKLQKNLIGKCEFEPNKKRAPRALIEYQRFRLLQDVTHLKVKDPISREYRALLAEEREKLIHLLEKQKTLGWSSARRALGLHEGEIFNLEEGKKKVLIGDRTTCSLRSAIGERWDEMAGAEREALLTDMLTIDNDAGFLRRIKNHWGFSDEIAEKLATTELEPGYARLSKKALNKILPHLQNGLSYAEACIAAGYGPASLTDNSHIGMLAEPPSLRNPVVQKALYETRKVVNAIIRRYGKPTTVRIEMARDMKLTKKQRDEMQKTQKKREEANDRAKEIIRNEFGIQNPTREDVQKYNMWVECKEVCPYTGRTISREMLFSPEVEVEHVLPYSRTLDDSFMNKTLCIAEENRNVKHTRTPYEAYHASEKKYLEILQRVKSLPWPKRKKFEQKELDTDSFIERQLNDTRYICREVRKYLQTIGVTAEVTKGEATAALRRRWNLNKVLSDGDAEKNRSDHRHHAVDAIVVALTSRALFQKLSRLSAQSGVALSQRGFSLEQPWPVFFNDVCDRIDAVIVSHAPARKISDALHEETAYGYDKHDESFVYRKPLKDLKETEIEKIRDNNVKRLVRERLTQFDGNIKKAFGDEGNPLLHSDGKTLIKSVRLSVNFNRATLYGVRGTNGEPYKFFKYGKNHHIEIIEHTATGKRTGIVVTAMEAARRARIDKKPLIQKTPPWFSGGKQFDAEWQFVMSLSINDMFLMEEGGVKKHFRIQKLSSNTQIYYLTHISATLESSTSKTAGTFDGIKIAVDPLGNAYKSND